MREFVDGIKDKKPNDALAEYDITMNVDGLHQKAGPTEEQLEYCDKLYNLPVLYGDPEKAYNAVDSLREGDIFLVIGASEYTTISNALRVLAKSCGAIVVEIQDHASVKVREFLENYERLIIISLIFVIENEKSIWFLQLRAKAICEKIYSFFLKPAPPFHTLKC